MFKVIKLKKSWKGFPVGTTTQVSESVAAGLIRDGFASEVVKRGAKPGRKKVTGPASTKG